MKLMVLSLWAFAISTWVLVWALPDMSVKRQARWDAFKVAHHCKLVERWAGNVGTDDEGSKTAYFCDDGVKYWR
jgi:hypothetical protein